MPPDSCQRGRLNSAPPGLLAGSGQMQERAEQTVPPSVVCASMKNGGVSAPVWHLALGKRNRTNVLCCLPSSADLRTPGKEPDADDETN